MPKITDPAAEKIVVTTPTLAWPAPLSMRQMIYYRNNSLWRKVYRLYETRWRGGSLWGTYINIGGSKECNLIARSFDDPDV